MFWKRKQLKDDAKNVLSRSLGKSIGVSAVGGYISNGAAKLILAIYWIIVGSLWMSLLFAFAVAFGKTVLPDVMSRIADVADDYKFYYNGYISDGDEDFDDYAFMPDYSQYGYDEYGYNDTEKPFAPNDNRYPSNSQYDIEDDLNDFLNVIIPAVFIGYGALIIFAYAMYAFIIFPLKVGICAFFVESRKGDARFSVMLSGFSKKTYLRNAKAGFLYELYIFLWTLLFFFPGIIKTYSYSMLPFILAENPEISPSDAFERTKNMTKGEKWRIFVLDLSFIGWGFVSMLTAFTGNILLMPYINAVYAELYAALKAKAGIDGASNISDI